MSDLFDSDVIGDVAEHSAAASPGVFDPQMMRDVATGGAQSAAAPAKWKSPDANPLEIAGTLAGGLAGSAAGGVRGLWDLALGRGFEKASQDVEATQHAFMPKQSPETQRFFGDPMNPVNWPSDVAAGGRIAAEYLGASPQAAGAVESGIQAAPMVLGLARTVIPKGSPAVEASPEALPGKTEAIADETKGGSVGASGVSMEGRLSAASDELRQDAMQQIANAKDQHGANWQDHVDWDALDRQLNADSLPIPGRLTKGQATQNGALISEEINKRNVNGLGPVFAAQNENQIANLKAIRDEATPDVYSNNTAGHSDTLIKAYEELQKADDKVVDDKWNNIRSQSSGALIFDAGKMLQNAQAALKARKLTAYDPGGQLNELIGDAQRGGLSADGYVAMRQNLGRVAMNPIDGNKAAAAQAVIDAFNKTEMLPEGAKYRDMVNDALEAGRQLHQKRAADPAYKAVVDGRASTADFSDKFVVNGKPESIAQMRANLAGNDGAVQTIKASFIDSLRKAAGIDDQYHGNFAANSFSKQMDRVAARSGAVFDNGELQKLEALRDYSNHIAARPRDSWVNYSNSAVELNSPTHAVGQAAKGIAASAAESALAAKTGGASLPFTGMLRAYLKSKGEAQAAAQEASNAAQQFHESTRPAAGIMKDTP